MDAIGFDAYNQCLTGRVAKTLNNRATDSDHLPCVIMEDNQTAVAYTVDMGGGKSSVCTYQEQSPTLTCTHYGEPAVAYTLKIRGGCDTYMKWDGKQGTAGKGALIQIEKSATIAVSQDQILFQPINNPE